MESNAFAIYIEYVRNMVAYCKLIFHFFFFFLADL